VWVYLTTKSLVMVLWAGAVRGSVPSYQAKQGCGGGCGVGGVMRVLNKQDKVVKFGAGLSKQGLGAGFLSKLNGEAKVKCFVLVPVVLNG